MVLGRTNLTIVVAGGAGFATFDITAEVKSICVIAPSGTATYTFDILDDSGSVGRMGSYGLQPGDNTVDGSWICIRSQIMRILNASVDGAYSVALYWRR